MKKKNKALKAGLWYTVSNVVVRAMGIVTAPIYTSMLTTADYGRANTFNSYIELFNVVTCLCVVYSIGRAKIDFKDKFDEYISALQGLSSTFAFAVLILAVLFRERLSGWIRYEVPLVIALFTYLCIYPSVQYMQEKCKFEYKYRQNIAISLYTCFVTIGMSIGFMYLFNDNRYIGKILGATVPTFMMGLMFYGKLLRSGKVFYNREYWTYALKIGLPMIPHAFALQALAQIDRIMILKYRTDSEAGLYSYGYSIATLLFIVTNAIGQAWLPWFNESLHNGSRGKICELQKKLVLLGCFMTLGFITVAPEALMILAPNGKDFWVAKYIIPPIAIGTLAQYFYTNYVNVELFFKKTPLIAAGSVFAAVTNWLLNCLLIPKYGYIAAAYTTMVSYLLLMVAHYFVNIWVLKEKVYADSYMFSAMGICMILGIAMSFLYKDGIFFVIVRYALAVVVLGVFAFIRRDDIMMLVDYVSKKYGNKL